MDICKSSDQKEVTIINPGSPLGLWYIQSWQINLQLITIRAEECRTWKNIQPLFSIQWEQQNLFWVRNRSHILWNLWWQYLFARKESFLPHFETLKKLVIILAKGWNTVYFVYAWNVPWGSPKLHIIAVISPHVVWGWSVPQPDPMAVLWHKSHHNTTIQCSFSEGIKPLRDHPHWILLPWGSGGRDTNHSHKRLCWGLGLGFFFGGGRRK